MEAMKVRLSWFQRVDFKTHYLNFTAENSTVFFQKVPCK